MKRINKAYRIAEVLENVENTEKLAKLYLVQQIIFNLKDLGVEFDNYRFSKIAGYDYNVGL